MSNIKQHIVSYPVAKWMQQQGFNEPCFVGYHPATEGEEHLVGKLAIMTAGSCYMTQDKWDANIPIPLWQQAIVWFQEQFNIAIETYYDPVLQGWAYKLYSTDTFETLDNVSAYETWYLCVEDAIEKCINIIDKICE